MGKIGIFYSIGYKISIVNFLASLYFITSCSIPFAT